jgi:hypothetical protein
VGGARTGPVGELPELLDVKDVAVLLGISTKTVYELIWRREIECDRAIAGTGSRASKSSRSSMPPGNDEARVAPRRIGVRIVFRYVRYRCARLARDSLVQVAVEWDLTGGRKKWRREEVEKGRSREGSREGSRERK